MSELKSSQPVVDLLNEAFAEDPDALHSLICNRVPCKQELGNTLIDIHTNLAVSPDSRVVGLIGLLNGILRKLGYNDIGVKIEHRNLENFHTMKGFEEWKPPS
jgi:hypothetical protein